MNEIIKNKTKLKNSDLKNINQIDVNEFEELEIVNIIKSNEISNYNSNIEINVLENARLIIKNIQLLNIKSTYTDNMIINVYKNATVEIIDIQLGSIKIDSKYEINLLGKGAKSNLNSIYLGYDKQIINIKHISNLYGKESHAKMNSKGALTDNSIKNYKGVIDFKKGAKKAFGMEVEQTILLSEHAINNSIPVLLCNEDDVNGEHAASAGKIDENKLFYIMSRGFSEIEAKKQIVKASFNSIIKKINDIELETKIIQEIEWRL